MAARNRLSRRGVAARSFGPWLPAPVWSWLNRTARRQDIAVRDCGALHPDCLAELDLPAQRRAYGDDSAGRPPKDAFSGRARIFYNEDHGNWNKGLLGGWQIDRRDPTADLRLVEFCLAVPTEQFQRGGVGKALARLALSDRLPQAVLDEPRRGLQAADWHERLTAVRHRVAAEIDQIAACPAVARMLDTERLRTLVDNWPSRGWELDEVIVNYRSVLANALSTGHFLRRIAGGNPALKEPAGAGADASLA
jgi:asparagine synthase (glutamine-hydrolysing)